MVLGAEGRDQGHQGRGALLKYRGEWSAGRHVRIKIRCLFDLFFVIC